MSVELMSPDEVVVNEILRCAVTNNPCGTDTHGPDGPCTCPNCRWWSAWKDQQRYQYMRAEYCRITGTTPERFDESIDLKMPLEPT